MDLSKYTVNQYKDKAGEHRLSVKHQNGNIIHASTESYKNIGDLIESTLNASIVLIDNYRDRLSEDHVNELRDILNSLEKQ